MMVPQVSVQVLPNWLQILMLPIMTSGWLATWHFFLEWQRAKREATQSSEIDSKLTSTRGAITAQFATVMQEERTKRDTADEEEKTARVKRDMELEGMIGILRSDFNKVAQIVSGPEGENGLRGNQKYLLDMVEAMHLVVDRLGTKAKIDTSSLNDVRR